MLPVFFERYEDVNTAFKLKSYAYEFIYRVIFDIF